MNKIFTLFFWLLAVICTAQSSVLSSGNWYRIGITESGIYKIDRNTLNALGIPDAVDPKTIKLYGNGVKGVLPQAINKARPNDLLENAIYVNGAGDGSFDPEDYLLFYGVGPDKHQWDEEGMVYEKNYFSDTTYYFLTTSGREGKRISSIESKSGPAAVTIDAFDDFLVHELEETNLISSGREWLGTALSSGETKAFSHQIAGLISNVTLQLRGVSQSREEAQFELSNAENPIGSFNIPAVPDGPGTVYSIKARAGTDTFVFPSQEQLDLNVRFNGNATGERGYIDFYQLTFKRSLQLYANETDFRWHKNTGELIRYQVKNAEGATVWNVSDPTNVMNQQYAVSGDMATFQSQSNSVEEFVVFSGSDLPTPFAFGQVANQNLRANTNIDGIIVTHPAFRSEALRLANFHQTHDGLNVQVATTLEVYNEFSSGRQDVSAFRDYAKYVFEKGSRLKYLLLFGDCSYDYKDRIGNNTNYVPTYQSRESFHPIFSYSSDDYFGFLADDEGFWEESPFGDHTMEIGIGRMPAKSLEEAQTLVDKIIYYTTSANTLGKWRQEITFVGDDGDGNIHAQHVEDLSNLIDTSYAQYTINKILLDAFKQVTSGSSERSPQAVSELRTRLKNGTFVVNYIGHGNERVLMEEEILTKSDIENLTNRNKLPIFVTATCEFGRYDNPVQTSGAEDLLLLSQGGAIALLTTSRPVFASTNFSLNKAFNENMFQRVSGQNLRLGDVIKQTKNEGLEGPVNRNFTLLGDPMMMPAYPALEIKLAPGQESLDTLSALEKVTFFGQIVKNGQVQQDFNGILAVAVYDQEQKFNTKGQEGSPYTYTLRSNSLFRGEVTVTAGTFVFSFVVPKNISYQNQPGKISMYALDPSANIDGGGSATDIIIGGTAANVVTDVKSPQIRMYLNDSSFVDGGTVGKSPLLIAQISDENGITTARAGVVEGISLEFQDEIINLNDFYTASLDDYTSGTVVFPLQNLAPGTYRAKISVWDTHNNASTAEISFTVSDEPVIYIYNYSAYPNPVKDRTTFSFEHDREDEDLSIRLIIYGSHGNVISDIPIEIDNSERNVTLPWSTSRNGRGNIHPGVYYSRLIIKSNLDGAVKEISQKLVIVN